MVHPSENKPIRAIIIDDEIEACYNLKNIIEGYIKNPDLELISMTQSTTEAADLIRTLKPDALFIDIEMGTENAFQFLERIAPFSFELIFVTAYDEYAVRAFRLNALDYILKPISISELKNAIDKLLHKVRHNRLLTEKGNFDRIGDDYLHKKNADSIQLRTSGKVDIISFKDLLYLEGSRAYSIFHFKKEEKIKEVVTSYSIAEYEQLLPAGSFFRIHKSYLVNCSHVQGIISEPGPAVLIRGCAPLTIGRRRLLDFHVFLSQNGYSV
jgi:two-component system LytT family response regulator